MKDNRDCRDNKDKNDKKDICDLLETFPPNFEVDNVIVLGTPQATTNFVSLDNGLATFRNNNDIKIFECKHIDGLDL